MNAKHTAAPWEIDGNDIFANGELIACAYGLVDKESRDVEYTDETYANAKLIAAAPELLEACRLFEQYDSSDPESSVKMMLLYADAIAAAKAAIAKATE